MFPGFPPLDSPAQCLGREIPSPTQEEYKRRYGSLPADLREQVKLSLLNSLVTEDPNARRGAAQVIAKIAAIELPLKSWPTGVSSLIQVAQHADPKIRQVGCGLMPPLPPSLPKAAILLLQPACCP